MRFRQADELPDAPIATRGLPSNTKKSHRKTFENVIPLCITRVLLMSEPKTLPRIETSNISSFKRLVFLWNFIVTFAIAFTNLVSVPSHTQCDFYAEKTRKTACLLVPICISKQTTFHKPFFPFVHSSSNADNFKLCVLVYLSKSV